jgi:hypothetical protein
MKTKKAPTASAGGCLLCSGLSSFDYSRLKEWLDDQKRKSANTAFTAGCVRDAARAFEAHDQAECIWTHDEFYEMWHTACGEVFCFADGHPESNSMKFCPYCGKRLKSVFET